MRTVQLFQKLLKVWLILVVLGGLCVNIAHAAVVDIVVNQSDSPDPIAAGGLLTYTIAVTNNGPDDATGVVLTDTIPVGTTFVSSTTTKGSCAGNPAITCTIGALANGETATVTIRIIPTTIGTLSNTATTTRNEPDSNAANNADTDVTTVQVGTDLSVTKIKSGGATSVAQGDTFSYIVTASNNGPYALGASDTLTITDNIPTGVRVTDTPTGGWSCTPAITALTPMNGPFVLSCTKTGSLGIGASATALTIPVQALSLGTITNQVGLSSSVDDDKTDNNTANQSTTVTQAADVKMAKTVSQTGNLGLQQNYTYTLSPTLVVGTTGTITVTDTLPSSLQLTSTPTAATGGWTCTPNSGFPITGAAISCTRASASNQSIAELALGDITVPFKTIATGAVNNTATVNGSVTDPVPSNNSNTAVSNTVINDIRVAKVAPNSNGNLGYKQVYSYTLQPRLVMGTTSATITLIDTFPQNTSGASLNVSVTALPTPSAGGWVCSATKVVYQLRQHYLRP